jgi:hypothetical protein
MTDDINSYPGDGILKIQLPFSITGFAGKLFFSIIISLLNQIYSEVSSVAKG